jgi:hypothetical protein
MRWKDVPDAPGYRVNDAGELWFRDRQIKVTPARGGIPATVAIEREVNGRRKRASLELHGLVAKAFVPNPLEYSNAVHLNGDRNDNRAKNLWYVTGAEHRRIGVEKGYLKQRSFKRGEKALNGFEAASAKRLHNNGVSLREIGREFGCSVTAVKTALAS